MAAFNAYKYYVIVPGGARGVWVSGASITLPTAATAQGLLNNGDISIDANSASATSVNIGNGGGGACHVVTTGDMTATVSVAAPTIGLIHGVTSVGLRAPSATAARLQDFPDTDGEVLVRNAAGTVVTNTSHATLSFNLPRDGANSTFSVRNDGTGVCDIAADGSVVAWGVAPPATQPILATGSGATVDDVIALLQLLGYCKQS